MQETTLCYLEQDEKYLLLFRNKKDHDVNQGKWIGIGGHLEEGESPEQCLIREVLEETGLKLKKFVYRGIIDFHSKGWESERMHLFTGSEWEGQLTESDEGTLAWIEKKQLFELPHWKGDELFLNKIVHNEPFFEMELYYDGDQLISVKEREKNE